jgi:type IV secretory pathway protease TraF
MAKDFVIVMPPEPLAMFLANRGYLPRGVPLIKPVLALAGQTVCREDLRIMVDDVYVGTAHSHDRLGRPLPEWHGCLMIRDDEVFLMNPNAPASLDGRYFGAHPVSSIIGVAAPIWEFKGAENWTDPM